ncbi:MAG: glucose-1-phosphate cytidylyltransferase [Anaerolineae bacterium]|nr:glucose-1-phosphate cytidylyltransferase [Phycisphaerae bacterium]
MKVVILAGGLGSRLSEETDVKPKPMVEIGGKPILWHIMQHYSSFGFNEFVLALGYRADVIKRYILEYTKLIDNLTIKLRSGDVMRHGTGDKCDWTVDLVDTGLHTQTGGRLRKLAPLIGNSTFMMTYGDGVSDVNINDLLAFHKKNGKTATLTAVRPPARFGNMHFDGDLISKFTEKPQTESGWINGGFFVLEPKILEMIPGDDTWFEREPLESCAAQRQLVAYKHDKFWQCMDTVRDRRYLEELWASGKAPWAVKETM